MKNTILGALAVLVVGASSASAITYTVDRTIESGTVLGSITTDGTIGVLAESNIVSWQFELTAPNLGGGSPDTISSTTLGATTTIAGSALTATSTDLFFNFSSGLSDFAFFRDGGFGENYWCLVSNISCAGGTRASESIGTNGSGASEAQIAVRAGNISVGTVTAAVPLPASLPLMALGLVSVGAIARRKRQAA